MLRLLTMLVNSSFIANGSNGTAGDLEAKSSSSNRPDRENTLGRSFALSFLNPAACGSTTRGRSAEKKSAVSLLLVLPNDELISGTYEWRETAVG